MGLLEGRVAIVTGAGSSIGKSTALRMSQEGAKMVVVDIVPDAGQETLATIKERGAEGIFIEADVTKNDHVERMVDTVQSNYGQSNLALKGNNHFNIPCQENHLSEGLDGAFKLEGTCFVHYIQIIFN